MAPSHRDIGPNVVTLNYYKAVSGDHTGWIIIKRIDAPNNKL